MPSELHLIERMGHVICLDKAAALWESRWWAISPATAAKLVGGRIYLHKAQAKPSYFGGRITAFRVETEGQWPGRIVFTFVAGAEYRGIATAREGWSMEKKIVLSD